MNSLIIKVQSHCLILALFCSIIAAATIGGKATQNSEIETTMSIEESSTADILSSTPEVISEPTPKSQVKNFIRRFQSTLQRAEPWLEEVEKEAKRIEQSAKQLSIGFMRSFKDIVGRILGSNGKGNGIPSFFGIIRINQGTSEGNKKTRVPCATDIKVSETTTIQDKSDVETSTKKELPLTSTTPDISAIVEDANAFDNEI